MKSERRHELETNQLADSLGKIPIYIHQYGSRIALGVMLVALVIILLYNRHQAKQNDAKMALDQLSAAREGVARLGNYEPLIDSLKPEERVNRFNDLVKLTRMNLDGAVTGLSDSAHLAEAVVGRGDLNWIIANYPLLAGTDETPAAPTAEDRAKALTEAAAAYQNVVDHYPQVTMALLSARMGLAAVAENKGDWDGAAKQYEIVESNQAFSPVFRDQAKQRMESLAQVSKPVLLVQTKTPMVLTTAPTSAPATTPVTIPVTTTTPTPSTAPSVE